MTLGSLIELKIAAGSMRDHSDVAELLRANPDRADSIRQHLTTVHSDYVARFDVLLKRAREQEDH